MTDVPPALAAATPGGWWSRHKLWVLVPLAILVSLAAFVGFIALIVWAVIGFMRGSDAYQQGLSRARANPAVLSSLGTPVEPGWLVLGNVELHDNSGNSDISFPVTGPSGSATIHVVGTESSGVWTYSKVDITLDGSHQVIDLSKSAP
jgi:Cytochrome oxidase complex assembly protein 1